MTLTRCARVSDSGNRIQQGRADPTEHSGIGGDAERQRENDDGSKSCVLARHPEREATVRNSASSHAPARTSLTCSFTCSTPPNSMRASRSASSGFMPDRSFSSIRQIEVSADFRRNVQFVFLLAGNIPEETDRARKPAQLSLLRHDASRARAIPSTIRSHFAVSSSNCFTPAFVSR